MKLFIVLALFSINSFASEISFKCTFTDEMFVPQFSLEAKKVVIEDGKFTNTEFDFALRKNGRNSQIERLVLTRDGEAQFFPAGPIFRHPTTRLVSVIKGAEVEYINLMIDMVPFYESQIRFLDGMTYLGSCKSI